jgi:pyruvate-formate lyase-activating enzyme
MKNDLRSKFRAAAGAIAVFTAVWVAVIACVFMMASCNPPCTNCNNSEQTETTVTDTTQTSETTNSTTISPAN